MTRHVAVIGAGYGGAALAKELENDAEVTLVDPRDAFVNVAGSLRALAQPDWAETMFFPLDRLLSRGTLLRDRAVSVDPAGVALASGRYVEADHIVLATGSRYPYPANPAADSTGEAIDDLRRTHKAVADADRILILGAGPVGLELAGEARHVWPDKRITIVDPAAELLPGYLPEVRADLRRQLADMRIDVRLGTRLSAPPDTGPGEARKFTATTTDGAEITADVWFRAHGVALNTGYLADGRLTLLGERGEVAVTEALNVAGYDHIYAIGDITDIAEPKRAGYADRHANVVAANIRARMTGAQPTATYEPPNDPMILLPLGPDRGTGQLPSPDGPTAAPAAVVSEYKGADLFTGRFAARFGIPK